MHNEQPRLAFHQGNGFISRAIRFQTRGTYSHVSIVLPSGVVIEAREFKGVQSLSKLTPAAGDNFVDVFDINRDLPNVQNGIEWLWRQVGKKYDYASVLRFLSRRQADKENAGNWFCSDIGFAFVQQCGLDLLRDTEPCETHPVMLSKTPFITHKQRIFNPRLSQKKMNSFADSVPDGVELVLAIP